MTVNYVHWNTFAGLIKLVQYLKKCLFKTTPVNSVKVGKFFLEQNNAENNTNCRFSYYSLDVFDDNKNIKGSYYLQ